MKPDGTVVASWGDIDAPILPRSANKPIQAMAFVESGAVERFGLGNEHIALACASHSGEKRHVETVRAWLGKVGLGEDDLECGTHPPRLQGTIEELVREGKTADRRLQQLLGQAQRLPDDGRAVWRADARLHQVRPSGAAPPARGHDRSLRQPTPTPFAYGTDGCGIPTLATPLKSLARAMASMAEPSRLSNKHAEAAGRIRAAMNAEPFMMAGTGRFCTRINAALPGVAQIKTGAEGVFCGMLPTLGLGVALKMWDGAARAAEVAMATPARPSRRPAGGPGARRSPSAGAGTWSACWSARCGRPRAGWGEPRTCRVTLDILEIGARGDGIAELDGERYFVPFTLPGEIVEAEPRDKRGEGIATDLLEVLAPSRHREAPPCAHFKVCGGCALQHWRRDAYTAWKVELIARALKQRGVDAPRFEPPLRRRAGRAAPCRLRAAPAGQARAGGLSRAGEPADRRCRRLRRRPARPQRPARAVARERWR